MPNKGEIAELSPAGILDTIREFFYGLGAFEFEQQAIAMRASLETLFMTITLGDMVGLPIIPPYYSMRLLPYVVPSIATWKRRVLREREFSDREEFDLHGL
jgi:hypothetical protein